MIAAGLLSERVTVERPTVIADGYGGQIEAWSPIVTDWRARVRALSSRDAVTGEVLATASSYEVTLRLSPETEGILATDRIVWNGLELRGEGAVIDRERREVRIICSAGAAVNV